MPATPVSTSTYTYGDPSWGDKLTAYNGAEFEYDAIGNPTVYNNGGAYSFTWENGRQLATATYGGNTLSFTYNDEGIRTSKTRDGLTTYYHLAGSQILSEEWTLSGVQYLIIYHYDANGLPVGMSYRDSTYALNDYDNFLYVKNLQGDIIKVLMKKESFLLPMLTMPGVTRFRSDIITAQAPPRLYITHSGIAATISIQSSDSTI